MARRDPADGGPIDDALRALRDHVAGVDVDAALRCGPFRLRRKIGSGAVADVFAASKGASGDERFAVKLLRPGTGGDETLQRFAREHSLLRSIRHAGIIEVLGSGIHPSGTPWFAMPLVDGAPITLACDARRLGMEARLAAVRATCDAVAAAHVAGVLHRDLKPGNVLLAHSSGEPAVKIIDFGMARAIAAREARLTPLGVAHRLGTPEYMAPEQWKDGIAECDARADVFAIGMLLGEIACGVVPRGEDSGLRTTASSRARRAPPPPCLPSEAFARLRRTDAQAADSVARARRMPSAELLQAFLVSRIDPLVAAMTSVARNGRAADAGAAKAILDSAADP
jgi:serine/threonine protein kinase